MRNAHPIIFSISSITAYMACAFIAATIIAALHGCALFQHQDPAAAAYAAERLNCVKTNETSIGARTCFDEVDKKYKDLRK